MKIKLKEVIILVAFIVVVSAGAIFIKNMIRNNKQDKEIEALINVEFNGELGSGEMASGSAEQRPQAEEKITVTGNAIAVLQIPSQGIKGVVKEGTDNQTLKNYIGMFKGAAMPGQVGNFSVAAHNNIHTELFRNLNKVNIGDEVKVTTRTNTYTYKITSKQTVSPTSIEVINNSNKKEITLITCNYNASARIVLKGELVQ